MRDKVIRELRGNWGCTREKAEELVDGAHGQMVIAEADLCQSLPYYPAQQIAEQNFLTHTSMLDDKRKISSMDDSKPGTKVVAGWWNHANEHYQNCFIPDCLLCLKFEQYALTMNAVEED